MSPRYACYRRPGFQRLFDDSSLLFDRSPPSHFSLGCLIKDGLLGCVHLFLMDTYRCAHIGQHPYLLSLRPDGSHQSLTEHLLASELQDTDFKDGSLAMGGVYCCHPSTDE